MSENTKSVFVHAMAATTPVCGGGEKEGTETWPENIGFCPSFCTWLDEEDWTVASDADTAFDEPITVNEEKNTTGETVRNHSSFLRFKKTLKKMGKGKVLGK